MTAMLIRVLVVLVILGAIFFGVRRIWRDWQGQFNAEDRQRHERDLAERKRPDVITLKRDKDGKFRPPDEERRG